MKEKVIDHQKLISELETSLEEQKYDSRVEGDGKVFELVFPNHKGKLEILINSKWVGLEFGPLEGINNTSLGYSIDTDLYPLDFDPEVTIEIFEEIKQLALDIINNRILIGSFNGEPVIARPYGKDKYEVKVFGKTRFFNFVKIDKEYYDEDKLPAKFSLKPI